MTTGGSTSTTRVTQRDRVRLAALRYATVPEQAEYIAIMRTFSGATSGLLSDQSAAEVAARLAEQGIELDTDTVDARLSYLVEHGNLARSPRETEARGIREYLQTRARYQLTQRGELVHRQVEELLGSTEAAREVSSEMLGGILDGLVTLDRINAATADPDEVARSIVTIFAQFERLVSSTREFYTYLAQVLSRYDLDRGEFQAFKTALLDYLQRFVGEISKRTPQIANALGRRHTPGSDAFKLCCRDHVSDHRAQVPALRRYSDIDIERRGLEDDLCLDIAYVRAKHPTAVVHFGSCLAESPRRSWPSPSILTCMIRYSLPPRRKGSVSRHG